jgi:hypothetical protein
MNELDACTARVHNSTTLADLLDAGFDAFEAIRLVARACEDRAPDLFAAFMTAAGTAVEGRNALNDAPSLPPARTSPAPAPTVSARASAERIADELAALAALLAQRLAEARTQAALAGDRHACQHAARTAAGIHRLLARDTDETAAG